jgi:TolB-like protein
MAAVLRDPAPPLAAGTAGLSGEALASLQRLLDSCLAKNAAARPAAMIDVLRDLDAIRRAAEAKGRDGARPHPAGRPASEQRSIVVLPFENLSPDPDNAFFANGLTEEIIADLSKIRALRVISRTSAMHYQGTTKPLPVIARELSVQHVLEGSVRRAGSSLRITAQLIDASTDAHLWAEKYTGTLDDIFEMQERVSRAIVGALEVHLTPGEARSLGRRAARDVVAYESYLRARAEIVRMSTASVDRAMGILDEALRQSPGDPLLRACKAYAFYQRVNMGGGADQDLAVAETLAAEVLREVPDLSLCHTVLGLVVATKAGQAAEAVRHLELALEFAPDDMDALMWLSLFYSFMGRTERAAGLAGRMIAVNPVDSMSYVALWSVHLCDGRFAEALATADRMVALAPDVEGCRFCRIQPLLALGRLEEAAVVAAWAELDRASFWRRHTLLAWRAFRCDRDGVLALLTPEFLESNRRDPQYSALVAEAYAQVEEPESAREWLENAVRLGYWNHHYLAERNPFLMPLRGEQRFEALMEKARKNQRALG